VPELDAGIMTLSLVPVIAALRGDRLDVQEQIALPGDPGGEPPGPVAAGRAGLPGGDEGEPGSPGRTGAIRSIWFAGFSAVPGGAGGGGPGAAVADGVALAVGHRYAPGGTGVAGGGLGQIAGQVGVDGANSVHLAGLVPRCSP